MRIDFLRTGMKQRCPHCGYDLDCFGRAGMDAPPRAGDTIVCMGCEQVNAYVADGVVRALTEAEVAALPPYLLKEIEKGRRMIRKARRTGKPIAIVERTFTKGKLE